MIYLSGAHNAGTVAVAHAYNLGLMLQPGNGYAVQAPRYPTRAADNGCFSQGERFQLTRFLAWLTPLAAHRATCLFAVAPDVYGDAAATIQRSLPVLPALRDLGFPAALVAQNGLTVAATPWEAFDVLFLGGAGLWKLSAEARVLVHEANRRGTWVHMGRVNSERRLRLAQQMGCDSVDGTYIKFGPDVNLRRLLGWLKRLPPSNASEVLDAASA